MFYQPWIKKRNVICKVIYIIPPIDILFYFVLFCLIFFYFSPLILKPHETAMINYMIKSLKMASFRLTHVAQLDRWSLF
jgi:hypothetical protein